MKPLTRVYGGSLLVLLLVVWLVPMPTRAQAPIVKPPAVQAGTPKPVATPAPPAMDDDDLVMVQTLTALADLANQACQGLEAVKSYNAQRARVQARIEARHPGLTINWATGALVAKTGP